MALVLARLNAARAAPAEQCEPRELRRRAWGWTEFTGAPEPVADVANLVVPGPSAVHDAHAALEWTAGNTGRLGIDPALIGVAGDSAGGNLAVATNNQCKRGRLYPPD